jgi:hypothetical protein
MFLHVTPMILIESAFKEIKILCEKNIVPFKNQTFTQFITQIRTKYLMN